MIPNTRTPVQQKALDIVAAILGPKAAISEDDRFMVVKVHAARYENAIDASFLVASRMPEQAVEQIITSAAEEIRRKVAADMHLVTQEAHDRVVGDREAIARDRDDWQERALNAESAARELRKAAAEGEGS